MKIGQLGQLMILGIVLFISCSKQDESTNYNVSFDFSGVLFLYDSPSNEKTKRIEKIQREYQSR